MSRVTLVKKAGHSIDAKVLAHLTSKCDGYVTVTGLAKGGILDVFSSEKPIAADKLFGYTEKLKTDALVLFMGSPRDTTMQPYHVLVNSDNKPIMVAFLDGNFSQYSQDGSAYPDEKFCVERDIIPRFKKLYGYMNGDLDKITHELQNDDIWANDIANMMVGDRGSIVLFAANGELATFAVSGDESLQTYDWGFVSNTFGGEAAPVELTPAQEFAALAGGMNTFEGDNEGGESGAIPPVTDKPAATNKGPRIPGIKSVPQVASVQPLTPHPRTPVGNGKDGEQRVAHSTPVASSSDKSDPVSWNSIGAQETVTIRIPKGMNPKSLSKWLRKRYPAGIVPPGAHLKPTVELRKIDAPKDFINSWLEQHGMTGMQVANIEMPKTEVKVVEQPKQQQGPPVQHSKGPRIPGIKQESGYPPREVAKAETQKPGVGTEALPLLSPRQKEAILNVLDKPETKALIAAYTAAISDPKEYAKLEKDIPKLAAQLGFKDITITEMLPLAVYEEIDKAAMNSMHILAYWLSWENRELRAQVEQLTKPNEAPKKEEPVKIEQKATGTDGAPAYRGPRIPGMNTNPNRVRM